MIVHVTEWYDNDSHTYFFDTSRVNREIPFEAAFADLLENNINKTVDDPVVAYPDIEARFAEYQDSMRCWERLKCRPPCKVDGECTLIMCSL